jgi:hypothetical protein
MKHGSLGAMRWTPLVAVLALMVGMWGCGKSTPSSPGSTGGVQFDPPAVGSGEGLLALSVQTLGTLNDSCDADTTEPGHGHHGNPHRTRLKDLVVTFDSIRIYPACHDSMEEHHGDSTWVGPGDPPMGDGPGDSTCAYTEFLISPLTLHASELDSSLVVLLGTLDLPDGDYSHVGLHISDAYVVTESDSTVAVELPDSTDFLHVPIRFTVTDGQVSEIVLRFDLARSVVEAPPGSLHFILKPVLHGMHGHGGGYMGDMGHGRGHGHGPPGGGQGGK